MRTRRGYGYAHRLTDDQRRALDELLDHLPATVTERAPRRSPRWGRLAAAAVAVAAVVVSASGIRALVAGPTESPAGATLRALAGAADDVSEPGSGPAFRRALDVVVFGRREECRFVAVDSRLWVPVTKPAGPATGTRMIVAVTMPPAAAAAVAGCADDGVPTPDVQPRQLFDGTTADPAATWVEAGRDVVEFPAFDDPWAVDPPAGDARWQALVGSLVGAGTDPAERAELLARAATWPGAEPVPGVATDLTGRPGTTLRVPYPGGTADLTFDTGTGALLQRVVRPADRWRVAITVYLDLSRTR